MRKTLEICRICASATHEIFKARILNKYDVAYYHCATCGFLQTEEPYWLEDAYKNSINISDTGLVGRNLYLAELTSLIIYFFFNKNAKYLDYAGGYGLFTRRMRDIGFDFYWEDRYSTNLLARGFEYSDNIGKVELVTSFESFEHFDRPLDEIEKMLSITQNLLFTTDVLPDQVPEPAKWHYFALHHGQHISFYSMKTLRHIACKYNLNIYIYESLFLLTPEKINYCYFKSLMKLRKYGLFLYIKQKMQSKTLSDCLMLTSV